MSRQYIRRSAGLTHEDIFVQINPYVVGNGSLDGDGLWGDKPFDSLDELARIAGWSGEQMDAFVGRLKGLLQ